MGLDLSKGIIRNNLEYGVIEPSMSKVKIIQVGSLVSFPSWYL
jgi:T-complex protein 1 subunit alpha